MKSPSFFCENCNREVSYGLDVCPGCGMEFSSVRCPSCGFTGESELFKENCPRCGYVGVGGEDQDRNLYSKESNNVNYKLPPWLYKVLIGLMVIIIISLIRIYFTL